MQKYLRIYGVVFAAFCTFLVVSSTCARADTVTFTLTNPLDSPVNPGEVISFNLQQGQAPDIVGPCGCATGPLAEYAQSEYFNVPIVEDGVSLTSNVFFCDTACALFSAVSAGDLEYFGGNFEPWSGLLTAPQFIPGSYQSVGGLCAASGTVASQCTTPNPLDFPVLTIAVAQKHDRGHHKHDRELHDVPEGSTFPLVLMGSLALFAERLRRSK